MRCICGGRMINSSSEEGKPVLRCKDCNKFILIDTLSYEIPESNDMDEVQEDEEQEGEMDLE